VIDLTEDNDPMLFRIAVPSGSLIVQWNELVAAVQKRNQFGQNQPTVADIAESIRAVSRTPEVAANAADEVLFAAFARLGKAVTNAGN
jgi:hypothetical protein